MTTKEFIRYLNDHPELCEKLAACTAPEEAYALGAAEGLTDSQEDFVAEMTRMKESLQISEEDLAHVAAAGVGTVLSEALDISASVAYSVAMTMAFGSV